jgi:hypothetical protein
MALARWLRRGMDKLHSKSKEAVTLRQITGLSRDADDDVTETYTDSTIYATSIQEITDDMMHERPGWFHGGTHLAYFKHDVGGISINNMIKWNGSWFEIIRVRKETTLGSVVYQEALLELTPDEA